MNTILSQKLKKLPKKPGVYIYRDEKKKIIYVGKAVSLKNRVGSYFNKVEKDPKTTELLKSIADMEWIEAGSEFEALIFEADLIKRYKPKYNVRLKDDKNYVYLKITKEEYPRISVIHQITDHEAEYIGPFVDSSAVKAILKMARKIFPYCSCARKEDEVCLYFHIGLCQGHDKKYISTSDYSKNIRGIKKIFSGKIENLKTEFIKEMKKAVKAQTFESAALYRDKIKYLERIKKSHFISERDLTADTALYQLKSELDLSKIPARIECFDISNILGTAATGSMVVFINGIASPKDYRRFQIKTVKGANDFASMAEILKRRFSLKRGLNPPTEGSTLKGKSLRWPLPDLVILDGGKGQLSAVLKNVEISEKVKVVALAKRYEEIVTVNNKQISKLEIKNSNLIKNFKFKIVNLSSGSEALYLVQRIRDEAHRFAVCYHRKLKGKEMFETSLDAIQGVGPKTKKKLLKEFGSIKKIKEASTEELTSSVGKITADRIKENL